MRNRSDMPTRNELDDINKKSKNDMDDKAEDIEKIVQDVESVRELMKDFNGETTTDGAEIIERSIENTEDVTIVVYEKEDENLEEIQDAGQEFEGELNEKKDISEDNMDKVADTEKDLTTRETIEALTKVKDSVNEELDFTIDQIEKIKAAMDESDKVQDALSQRVRTGSSR